MVVFGVGLSATECDALAQPGATSGSGVLIVGEEGLTLSLCTTKTEQIDGEVLRLRRLEAPNVVAAVKSWLRAADIAPGTPVFRGLRKGGRVLPGRLTPSWSVRSLASSPSMAAVI
jgi:hypothetical protein